MLKLSLSSLSPSLSAPRQPLSHCTTSLCSCPRPCPQTHPCPCPDTHGLNSKQLRKRESNVSRSFASNHLQSKREREGQSHVSHSTRIMYTPSDCVRQRTRESNSHSHLDKKRYFTRIPCAYTTIRRHRSELMWRTCGVTVHDDSFRHEPYSTLASATPPAHVHMASKPHHVCDSTTLPTRTSSLSAPASLVRTVLIYQCSPLSSCTLQTSKAFMRCGVGAPVRCRASAPLRNAASDSSWRRCAAYCSLSFSSLAEMTLGGTSTP